MTGFSGTSMPLATRVKNLKEGLRAHTYDETCSNPKEVNRTIVENEGRKVGEYVTVGGKVVQSSSTPDARMAGVGMGKDETTKATSPAGAVSEMNEGDSAQPEKEKQKEESLPLTKSVRLKSLRKCMMKKAAPIPV